MAFRNSAAQSIKEKDAKDLIILIKARDLENARLIVKIKALEDYQKRNLVRTERELKFSQDQTKKAKAEVQALQDLVEETKTMQEQLHGIIDGQKEAMITSQKKVSALMGDKHILIQKSEASSLQFKKRDKQFIRLHEESAKLAARVQISLDNTEKFLKTLVLNPRMQHDYATALCDTQFLSIEIKAFSNLLALQQMAK